MTLFVASVVLVLVLSAICSLTEAALYAVRMPYVRHLTELGSPAGKLLTRFKLNMERPISAILILNTAANTAGAAVAGAQAVYLFGEKSIFWFSATFTLAVLFLAEIGPKVIGVAYNQAIARWVARPLHILIRALYPFVWTVEQASRLLIPKQRILSAPEEEVGQLAMMSAEEGSILPFEADLVQNVLRLDQVRARDIMTPRPVVLKLPASMTLAEVAEKVKEWTHSRIPIYADDDPETWVGVVLARDILANLAVDKFDVTLASLAGPIHFVSDKTPGHVLLKAFLKRRSHLFGVVDQYGSMVGIVTLEDVMEALIGEEIVDEVDLAVDMQEVARLRRRQQFGQNEDRTSDQ
ncbi:MAG: CNNM domain-containing protein [Pirellulales bacterium]